MDEISLKPGWLARDCERASKRVIELDAARELREFRIRERQLIELREAARKRLLAMGFGAIIEGLEDRS